MQHYPVYHISAPEYCTIIADKEQSGINTRYIPSGAHYPVLLYGNTYLSESTYLYVIITTMKTISCNTYRVILTPGIHYMSCCHFRIPLYAFTSYYPRVVLLS